MRNMKLADAWLFATLLSHHVVQGVYRISARWMQHVVSDSLSFCLGNKAVAPYKKQAELFLKVTAKLALRKVCGTKEEKIFFRSTGVESESWFVEKSHSTTIYNRATKTEYLDVLEEVDVQFKLVHVFQDKNSKDVNSPVSIIITVSLSLILHMA